MTVFFVLYGLGFSIGCAVLLAYEDYLESNFEDDPENRPLLIMAATGVLLWPLSLAGFLLWMLTYPLQVLFNTKFFR